VLAVGQRDGSAVMGHLDDVILAQARIHFSAMSIQPCVYILANGSRGTLYVGVTGDLVKRVWQHTADLVEGFTRRYSVHLLVW
jgi:hypothetical protein